MLLSALIVAGGLTPSLAVAKPGFSSAGANRLWVGAAELAATKGAPTDAAVRAGVWLDVDGGARSSQSGSIWGLRLGWVGSGTTATDAMAAAAVGAAGRVGVATSAWAWNAWLPGELLLTTDLWVAYDKATWYGSGVRAAPRIGVRVLLGYGAAVRARLRVDVAPALFVAAKPGTSVSLSAVWLRFGVDVGPVTVAAWTHVALGDQDGPSGWRRVQDRALGVAVGLRSGRGRAR